MAHRTKRVFPNNFVLVNSQEFGSSIQIREVKKISKNLSFSSVIIVLLSVLHIYTLDEVRIIRIIGRLEKFNRILGKKIKKN